jgi:uracil-DNA glycosylase family 4
VLTRPPTCTGCPLHEQGKAIGYCPPSGPLDAKVLLVGQGPGKEEVEGHFYAGATGRHYAPFIGRAGHRLDHWLRASGAPPRSTLRIDNAIRCLYLVKGKDKEAPPRALAHCTSRHLFSDAAQMPNLVLLVGLGTTAIRALYGPSAGERWAGSLLKVRRDQLLSVGAPQVEESLLTARGEQHGADQRSRGELPASVS